MQFTFQIPESKLAKLERSLQSLILDGGRATYKELARLAGFILSLSLAVGPIARLFTRQMYFISPLGMFLLRFLNSSFIARA